MYKLLLVVDEMLERKLLYKKMQKYIGNEYEIYEAADEKEAMEIVEKEKIQIAVFLKAEQVIVLKAVDYLVKPYTENELIDVIKEATAGHSAGKEKNFLDDAQTVLDREEIRLSKVKKRIERYVQNHYMEEISMYDAAGQMNYSEAYFCKLFKQCFGINFTTYLAKYRIKEAKKLLESSNMSAKEIGKVCGYSDPCYFTRVFKREVGSTPSEYRNRYINDEIL